MHSSLKFRKSAHKPIYQELFDDLKQAILARQYSPGSRVPSINELQSRYHIARETAKLVLKMLADQGYIIKVPGKGSFVRDIGPKKPIWGVITPSITAHTEDLIFQLRNFALRRGRHIESYVDDNSWEQEIRLTGQLINDRYEAVIIIPTFNESKTAEFYSRGNASDTVITLLDHTMSGSYFTYVIQSYDLGVKRAVGYLTTGISQGTFGFVKNHLWAGRNSLENFMEQNYRNFIDKSGESNNMVVLPEVAALSREYIKHLNIRGIFCCDDLDAMRIIGRLKEWNIKIPEEVKIISYGNTDLARYFTPPITSIDPHCAKMASITVDIITDKLSGKDMSHSQYVVQPTLIVRGT